MMPQPPPICPPLRLCQSGLSFPSNPSVNSVGLATDGTQLSCSTAGKQLKRIKHDKIKPFGLQTIFQVHYLCIPCHRSTHQRCNLRVPHSGLDRALKCRPHPKQKVEHLYKHCSLGTSGIWFYWKLERDKVELGRNGADIFTMSWCNLVQLPGCDIAWNDHSDSGPLFIVPSVVDSGFSELTTTTLTDT